MLQTRVCRARLVGQVCEQILALEKNGFLPRMVFHGLERVNNHIALKEHRTKSLCVRVCAPIAHVLRWR